MSASAALEAVFDRDLVPKEEQRLYASAALALSTCMLVCRLPDGRVRSTAAAATRLTRRFALALPQLVIAFVISALREPWHAPVEAKKAQ